MTHFWGQTLSLYPRPKSFYLLWSYLPCMEGIRTSTSGPKSSGTTERRTAASSARWHLGSLNVQLTQLHAVTHPDTELLRRKTLPLDYIWGNTLHGQQPVLMGCLCTEEFRICVLPNSHYISLRYFWKYQPYRFWPPHPHLQARGRQQITEEPNICTHFLWGSRFFRLTGKISCSKAVLQSKLYKL